MNKFVNDIYKSKFLLFEKLRNDNKKRQKVKSVLLEHTNFIDNIFKGLFKRHFFNNKVVLIALGSYARKQLNPYSDIDIMIIREGVDKNLEPTVREIYDTFYALDYEISVAVRTKEECIQLAKDDHFIKISMFDSRFILGSKYLFNSYMYVLKNNIMNNNIYEFINETIEVLRNRHEKYGNTVFVLEPNVKESTGGLRDYHTLLWIAKSWFLIKKILDMKNINVMDSNDYLKLRHSLYFLWQLRNAMHFITNKKNDILFLDLRNSISSYMGFEHPSNVLHDRLMRRYYYYAKDMKDIVLKYIDMFQSEKFMPVKPHVFFINNKIFFRNKYICIESNKIKVQDAFELLYYAALYNYDIDVLSLDLMDKLSKDSIWQIRDDTFINFVFKNFLSIKKPIHKQIRFMHQTSLLDKFIPEFGNIYCLTEMSLYHKYTVDEHSIQALEFLDELFDINEASNFLMNLKNILRHLKEYDLLVLRLAILLHDIGKVKSKRHEIVGSGLAKNIANRMRLGTDLTNKLMLLIENHLIMSRIISRMNIYDTKVLENFANIVKNKNQLSLLCLLTYVDMKSVNDNVWNQWKENLIYDLYLNTLRFLENKNYDEYLRFKAREVRYTIIKCIGKSYEKSLEALPEEIFNNEDVEHITDYIMLIENKNKAFNIYDANNDFSKLFVYYKNEFGLFNKISGVLTCFDVNIVAGRSYTLKGGMIIDVLTISRKEMLSASDVENFLEKIEKNNYLLDECMAKKNKRFLNRLQKTKLILSLDRTKVVVDNNLSDLYTAFRVYAPDRTGLIYDITKLFFEFKLFIGMFILDTKGEMAVDTFYISTENGKKIYSEQFLDLIKNKIMEVVLIET